MDPQLHSKILLKNLNRYWKFGNLEAIAHFFVGNLKSITFLDGGGSLARLPVQEFRGASMRRGGI